MSENRWGHNVISSSQAAATEVQDYLSRPHSPTTGSLFHLLQLLRGCQGVKLWSPFLLLHCSAVW